MKNFKKIILAIGEYCILGLCMIIFVLVGIGIMELNSRVFLSNSPLWIIGAVLLTLGWIFGGYIGFYRLVEWLDDWQ